MYICSENTHRGVAPAPPLQIFFCITLLEHSLYNMDMQLLCRKRCGPSCVKQDCSLNNTSAVCSGVCLYVGGHVTFCSSLLQLHVAARCLKSCSDFNFFVCASSLSVLCLQSSTGALSAVPQAITTHVNVSSCKLVRVMTLADSRGPTWVQNHQKLNVTTVLCI